MIDVNDEKLRFIPVEIATTPPEGLINHLKDRWWVVHPERGVVFWRHSAQCNSQVEIVNNIAAKLYPWAQVKFLSSVFHKINPSDYT